MLTLIRPTEIGKTDLERAGVGGAERAVLGARVGGTVRAHDPGVRSAGVQQEIVLGLAGAELEGREVGEVTAIGVYCNAVLLGGLVGGNDSERVVALGGRAADGHGEGGSRARTDMGFMTGDDGVDVESVGVESSSQRQGRVGDGPARQEARGEHLQQLAKDEEK